MESQGANTVESLVDHINDHAREKQLAKDQGREWKPSREARDERARLMKGLLAELSLTKEEVWLQMGIQRPTWERWERLETVPGPKQLEKLRQLKPQGELGRRPLTMAPSGSLETTPVRMLDRTPKGCTWGRLRLVYSLFPWNDAVLYYPVPFTDAATVTEMALLTLRDVDSHGTSVIYILQEDKFEDWRLEYVGSLKRVFGRQDAARAASGICAIRVPKEILDEYPMGLGIFNYILADENMTVGYEWSYKPEEGDPERPKDDHPGVYSRFTAEHDPYAYVKRNFNDSIKQALEVIAGRRQRLPRFWQPSIPDDDIEELLRLPSIKWESNQGNHESRS